MNVVICNNCKSFYTENVKKCQECHGTTFSITDLSNRDRIRWTLTDSDHFQFGRQIDDRVFEFKEYDWFFRLNNNPDDHFSIDEAKADTDNWIESGRIDLDKLSDDDLKNAWETYYSSLDEIKNWYGDEWEFIVAECYFEIKISGLY